MDIVDKPEQPAIIYARVSTEEQAAQGFSLSAQVARLETYASLHNLKIVAVLKEEGVSGNTPIRRRPAGIKLVSLLHHKQARHVIALKLDRLFRNALDCLETIHKWDQADIVLHLVDMGGSSMHTRSAIGKFFIAVTAGFAELERNLISERTKVALTYKKKNGLVYGHIPYGFKEGRKNGQRCLCEDEHETKILLTIYALRSKWWAFREIGQYLYDNGIPNPSGKLKPWEPSTIRRLLANDLYKNLWESTVSRHDKPIPREDVPGD
jgi:site-specific DNA recombinase